MILYFLDLGFSGGAASNLLSYITFRILLAALFSFSVTILLMPSFIRWIQSVRWGQMVRDDGPQSHLKKSGTPTMGGVLMVFSILVTSLLLCRLNTLGVWIILISFLASALLGFSDDFLKLAKKNSKGVSFRWKMIVSAAIALLFAHFALQLKIIQPEIHLPFLKDIQLPIGALYYIWAFLVLSGATNAVNLTDGLDGLAIVPIMTTGAVLLVMSYCIGHAEIASYLRFEHLSGAGEYSVIMAAVIGSGLGFLWFNAHPAQIFMGDVGSLSLGSILAATSLLIYQELVLFLAGFLFVLEAMSVIIQVGYFKKTKKRVFRMAPLHHHFELGGWHESKVIVRFWILSIIFAVIALSALKLR